MVHTSTHQLLPVETSICMTPGNPLVQNDLTKTMYTRTPTFKTRHLKLAKTFPDHANQPVVDPYMIVVTHGTEDMFVNITGKNLDQNLLHIVTTTLCWGNDREIM